MKDPRIRTPLLAPSMRLVSSLMRLSIATLLMVLLWGACGDDGWVPEVGSVEVIPHKVFALAGESFLLQARIRDPDGDIINIGGFDVDPWEASNDLVVLELNPSGLRVVVTATETPTQETSEVTATIDGISSSPATITILPGPEQTGFETVAVNHFAEQAPSIVRVDATGIGVDDHTIAVAGQGLVPTLTGTGQELTVFAPDRAVFLRPIPQPPEVIRQTNGGIVARNDPWPLKVRLAIWLVGNITAADVEPDVLLAEAIFLESRAGVKFFDLLSITEVTDPADATEIGTECADAEVLPAAAFDANALNIYYVSGMADRGMSCAPPLYHPVIYVSADDAWDETLAHELGHRLGLIYPYPLVIGGHTTGTDGFEKNNIMWGVGHDRVPTRRHDLSLGQVFSINVDCRSWVNEKGMRGSTALTKCCQCDPYATGPCPLLAHDVVPVTSTGSIPSGWCSSVVCPSGC